MRSLLNQIKTEWQNVKFPFGYLYLCYILGVISSTLLIMGTFLGLF